MSLDEWLKETIEQGKQDGIVNDVESNPGVPRGDKNSKGTLKRRTVGGIDTYLSAKQIYKLITSTMWPYAPSNLRDYKIARDRAMMAMCYLSAGRIKAVLQLQREHLHISDDCIVVHRMDVVKRKPTTVAKYGVGVKIRDDFPLPLKRGMMKNPNWDELVPFSKLVLQYIRGCDPQGRLFEIGRGRAWQIIEHVTGYFCHWFRAQSEHFYGNYIMKDAIRLSRFVKIVRPAQVAHYIGYEWTEELKDKGVRE